MNKRTNWQQFKELLDKHGIKKLYHFTDRDNIESIIKNGGLYSWADCDNKGITIKKPGGGDTSRSLDRRDNLQNYVRVSFTKKHPMMYVAMNDGRITNPEILEIDPEVIFDQDTKYADRNATKNGACVGGELEDFEKIHFSSVKALKHFDLLEEEQEFYQAEVLVKNFIPLKYITNIAKYGISIPAHPEQMQSKEPYTSQITRKTPTAFIFLVDHSVSMSGNTTLNGTSMSKNEAVAQIINHQINELVLRCIKGNEIRNYFDIAVVGYGEEVYSGWGGNLEGRYFVTPQELKDNPYKKITVKEEKCTRRGVEIKEVEKVQWVPPRADGSWTRLHKAVRKAKELLDEWINDHKDVDCYPPTVINITDGMFNGISEDDMLQICNELKSMSTNDGNVIFMNIHISNNGEKIVLPVNKTELKGNEYSTTLCDMSSLLPTRYNDTISKMRNDANGSARHYAMGVNADTATIVQLMDIGTPTNIALNK